MANGIEVTVRDLLTGDVESAVIEPGDYVCVCAEPLYFAEARKVNATGTVQLTLKRRKEEADRG